MPYGLNCSFLHRSFDGFGRYVAAHENCEIVSFRFELGERFGRAALTSRSDRNFDLERAHLELDIPHEFFIRERLHHAQKVRPSGSIRKGCTSTSLQEFADKQPRRELDVAEERLHGRRQ